MTQDTNPNAVVSRHRLSHAEAVVCADGSASLLNVVYQGSEFIKGNGTCPHPLRLSDEAQKRYDTYPKMEEACRAFLAWASSGIDGMPDADQLAEAVEKARSALGLS